MANTCDLYGHIPLKTGLENLIETNAETLTDIGKFSEAIRNSVDGYPLGSRVVFQNYIWLSTVDNNKSTPSFGIEYANLTVIARDVDFPYKAVNAYSLTANYSIDEMVYVTNGSPVVFYRLRSLINDNVGNTPPLSGDANWEVIDSITYAEAQAGKAVVTYPIRQDIENGASAGEQFYDPLQKIIFLTVVGFSSGPDNTFPFVDDGVSQSATSDWLIIGLINQMNIFDESPSTIIKRKENLTVELFYTSIFDSFFLFNLLGSTANITLYDVDNDIETYNKTFNLIKPVGNYWDWGMKPYEQQEVLEILDFVPSVNTRVTITIDGATDEWCGFGRVHPSTTRPCGLYQYESQRGITNTTREADSYEGQVINKGRVLDSADFPVFVPHEDMETIFPTYEEIVRLSVENGQPTYFRTPINWMNVLGLLVSTIPVLRPAGNTVRLDIRGLTK